MSIISQKLCRNWLLVYNYLYPIAYPLFSCRRLSNSSSNVGVEQTNLMTTNRILTSQGNNYWWKLLITTSILQFQTKLYLYFPRTTQFFCLSQNIVSKLNFFFHLTRTSFTRTGLYLSPANKINNEKKNGWIIIRK